MQSTLQKDGRWCGSLLNRRVKGYSSQHVEPIYETWNYWAAKSKDSDQAAHSTNSIITKSFYKSYAMDINIIQRLMYSYITAPSGVVYECPIVYCNMHHHLVQHPFCIITLSNIPFAARDYESLSTVTDESLENLTYMSDCYVCVKVKTRYL